MRFICCMGGSELSVAGTASGFCNNLVSLNASQHHTSRFTGSNSIVARTPNGSKHKCTCIYPARTRDVGRGWGGESVALRIAKNMFVSYTKLSGNGNVIYDAAYTLEYIPFGDCLQRQRRLKSGLHKQRLSCDGRRLHHPPPANITVCKFIQK